MAMKEKQKKKPAAGISFSTAVTAKAFTKQPSAWMTAVMPALLLFAGVSGALFCLITAYDLSCDYMAVFFCAAIGSVGFTLLYRLKRVGAWVFPISFGLFLAILTLCKDTLMGMAINVYDTVLVTLRNANVPNLPQPIYRFEEYYPSLTLLWAVVVLFLCITLGYCIVRRSLFLPAVLVTFPFLEVGLFYGRAPALWALLFLLCCLLSQLAAALAVGRFRGSMRRNRVCAPYSRQLTAPVSFVLCLVMTVCLLDSQAALSLTDYQRPQMFETLRTNYQDFDWLSFLNPAKADRIGEGNLWAAGNLKYDYQTDLLIEMPYTQSTLYFKGYTGSVYTGTNWEQIPDSAYETFPLFRKGGQNDINAYELLNAYYGQYGGTEIAPIQITSVRAGTKYAFVPYFSMESKETLLEYDRYAPLLATGNTYSVYYGYSLDESSADLAQLSRPPVFERHPYYWDYQQFVSEVYTQFPADMGWLYDLTWQICSGSTSVEEMIGRLKRYFWDNTSYSTSPGRVPSNMDFTEYFLLENKKGYCVHYATAGALMLQSLGVPARYVEGYLVGPDEFSDAPATDKTVFASRLTEEGFWITDSTGVETYYTLDIDDSKRHAWVEVYDAQQGWIPVEFTPGYSASAPVREPEDSSASEEPSVPSSSRSPVSSAPSSSSSSSLSPGDSFSGPSKGGTVGPGGPMAVMLVILAVVLTLMLLLLVILARQAIVQKRRQNSFHTQDENQNVLALYRYLCKLLSFAGCKTASIVCYEPALLQSRFSFLSQEECDRCMELVLKARFSGQPVKKEERKEVSRLVFAIRKQLYEEKNWLWRLWMQYVRCL